ncbi:hypothetical protein ACN08Y_10265 [Rothia sp. P5764]|uniref:hypothetical protein n=1 Tax=Rothia sp. P5764 TaxID=3402654 RepID=UPI003AD401E9
MSKMRIELNSPGIRKYLQGESVQGALRREAERIAQASGEGYEANVKVGRTRALANVRANTVEARLDNSKRNTILRNAR